MNLSDRDVEFLRHHHSAAMITVPPDGIAKAVRIGVAPMDGKLWSSGTQQRVRTQRLRADPRSTLFVFEPGFGFLTMETTVTILDGPDAPEQNVRLFREMQHQPAGPIQWFGRDLTEDQFLETMAKEGRLIYEFDVDRAYGVH